MLHSDVLGKRISDRGIHRRAVETCEGNIAWRENCLLAVLSGLLRTAVWRTGRCTRSLVLSFPALKVFGSLHIAGGDVELQNGAAMIVTTSAFGFVPSGGQANEDMVNGVGKPEFGDPAIHDAIIEGANFANGYWNGTNGIVSIDAQNRADGNFALGWLDNSTGYYSSFYGSR